jgi:hypothetical protein
MQLIFFQSLPLIYQPVGRIGRRPRKGWHLVLRLSPPAMSIPWGGFSPDFQVRSIRKLERLWMANYIADLATADSAKFPQMETTSAYCPDQDHHVGR